MSTVPGTSQIEETGVIICGGGPTGTALSVLLGHLNIPNIVLEREKDITTDPRGIALDEDGIRILQSIGIYERVYTEIGTCKSQERNISRRLANAQRYGEVQFRDRRRNGFEEEATLVHEVQDDRRRYGTCRLHMSQATGHGEGH